MGNIVCKGEMFFAQIEWYLKITGKFEWQAHASLSLGIVRLSFGQPTTC